MSTTERTKTVSYGWPCWFLSCSISVLLEFRSSKTLGLPFSKFRVWILFIPAWSIVFCLFGCCKAIWRCQLAQAGLPSHVSRRDQVTHAKCSQYKPANVLQVALTVLVLSHHGLNDLYSATPGACFSWLYNSIC